MSRSTDRIPILDPDDRCPTVVGVDVSLDDFSFWVGLVVGAGAGLVIGIVLTVLGALLWL